MPLSCRQESAGLSGEHNLQRKAEEATPGLPLSPSVWGGTPLPGVTVLNSCGAHVGTSFPHRICVQIAILPNENPPSAVTGVFSIKI